MTNQNMNRARRRAINAEWRKALQRLRDIYNRAPSMIHEDQYQVIDCILCGKTMPSVHHTNAADPLTPLQTAKEANLVGNIGRCCRYCNENFVIPARSRDIENFRFQ